MLALGPIQVLLPLYAKDILRQGELARGTLLFALGPGLFLGGVLSVLSHHREGKGKILLFIFALSSLVFLFLVPFLETWITMVSLFLFGVLGGVVSSLLPALLQKNTPDALRGRVLSLYMVAFQFTPAVSGLLSGKLAESLGIIATFTVLGVTFFVIALGALSFFRDLREA